MCNKRLKCMRSGFTLIELMISLVIMSLIAIGGLLVIEALSLSNISVMSTMQSQVASIRINKDIVTNVHNASTVTVTPTVLTADSNTYTISANKLLLNGKAIENLYGSTSNFTTQGSNNVVEVTLKWSPKYTSVFDAYAKSQYCLSFMSSMPQAPLLTQKSNGNGTSTVTMTSNIGTVYYSLNYWTTWQVYTSPVSINTGTVVQAYSISNGNSSPVSSITVS